MPTSRKTAVSPVFTDTKAFIRQFAALDEDQANVAAIWVMGTWTFSPASPASPYTYPYLYITGPTSAGKSTLGQQVFGSITRLGLSVAGATGPSLFKMMGDYDDESGEVIANYRTLLVDEIDATYNGAKDESLRQMFNIGYRQGVTVPRSSGKTAINFPVYGPKVLMGIDNGHLPETVTNRSIRIEMQPASKADQKKLMAFFPWNVDEPSAELQERLATWAKQNALILREYDPKQPDSLGNRKWEISRSLVQLAKAAGVEKEILTSIVNLFTRSTERPPLKVRMYKAIWEMFESTGVDKASNKMLKAALDEAGITVTGNSLTGMSYMLKEDGLPEVDFLSIKDPKHPAYNDGKTVRGYWRHRFDDAFAKYLTDEDED